MSSLEKISDYVGAIRSLLADIEAEITDRTAVLTNLNDRVSAATDAASEAERSLAEYIAEVDAEKQQLDKQLAQYRQEVDKLKGEVVALVSRKGDLKVAISKLEQQSKSFKEYEAKAWKSLKAKDEDLLARERNVRQKEAINPSARTFLPEA